MQKQWPITQKCSGAMVTRYVCCTLIILNYFVTRVPTRKYFYLFLTEQL